MHFERLLAAQLAALALSACSGTGQLDEESCDQVPEGLVRIEGYVAVSPGAACPDAGATEALSAIECCPSYVYKGVNCGFVRREDGMIPADYTGGWRPADSADTGDGSVRDLCFYEGIFEETNACCGRPLLDEGRAVLPRVAEGAGWRSGASLDPADLSDAERRAVAAHWLASARLEHASVASFARVTLDLLRLGAPPALLADVHRAGLDEIEHARLCFALASAASGRALDPGPLAVPDLPALDRLAVAEALVREGCVGETLAAIDAAARLHPATDPAVRAALTVIVADEGRHAALAWRTLAWLLATDADGALRQRVDAVFAEERATLAAAPRPDAPAVPSHGVIAPADSRAATLDGFERVIAPAWAALAA